MKHLSLIDVVSNIGGELIKGNFKQVVTSATLRAYKIKNKTLYFDLYKDEITDLSSIPKDKSFVIVTDREKNFEGSDHSFAIVKVKDTESAYWNFVDYYRGLFNFPVIGVTGTCGKTTTKEMIKHILSLKYENIVATYKSVNQKAYNLIYMLEIDDSTDIATIEMGVTYPEDLSIYCRYFKPQIGVITNIGVDHLNYCKTVENYISAKARLLDGMDNKGTLILNADSENLKKLSTSGFKGKIIYFGFDNNADFKASDLKHVKNGLEFSLKHNNKNYKVFVPTLGEFNAYNALAAIAAVSEAGIDVTQAIDMLKSFKNVEKHLQIRNGVNGSTIIDDTWSTNPTSAAEAIKVLKNYSKDKRTIAVLGEMNLLGKYSENLHRELGKKIADTEIDYLLTIDDISKSIGVGALENGMCSNHIYNCSNLKEIMMVLDKLIDKYTVVLVKTSMLDSYEDLIDKLTV